MKLSLYSYLFEKEDNCYLYNSQTGLFSKLSKPVYEALFDHDLDRLDDEVQTVLKEKQVIVEDDKLYDYYHYCRHNYFTAIGNYQTLVLVLAPTTGCNFACPYCFEGEKKYKRMTPEVIDSLITFIKSYTESKELSITWYGGEPLLAFDIMKEIVNRIKAECPQKLTSQSMVTNGYLINEDVVDFMKKENFKKIQITFDGTEESHNKTRCLKGSLKPTYNRIMENVDRLVAKMPPEFQISLRININRDNEHDFLVMHDMMGDKYKNRRIYVYPGFIREDSKDGCRLCYKSLTGRSKFDFFKRVESYGASVDFYPKKKEKGCMVCLNNSFVVGPEGELYKCWNDFNHQDKIVGYIQGKKITNATLLDRYGYEATLYSDPKCKECMMFPICDGGCGWMRSKNVFEGKEYNLCTYLTDRSCLEESLLKNKKAGKDCISAW